MTLGHFLYIPGMLLVGCVLGYLVGSRARTAAQEEAAAKDLRRAARDARRRGDDQEGSSGAAR